MAPPSFDNIINKLKSGTKQCADQMSKAARATRLKIDIMTQSAEKSRLLQNIGEKTYQLYGASGTLDGLADRVAGEFSMIKRIDMRISEIETELAELKQSSAEEDITVAEVKDVTVSQPTEEK